MHGHVHFTRVEHTKVIHVKITRRTRVQESSLIIVLVGQTMVTHTLTPMTSYPSYVIALNSTSRPDYGDSYPHPYYLIPLYYVIAIYSISIPDNGESYPQPL